MKFDIWVFLEGLEEIQVLLRYDKNNGYIAWRPIYISVNISPSSSYEGDLKRNSHVGNTA